MVGLRQGTDHAAIAGLSRSASRATAPPAGFEEVRRARLDSTGGGPGPRGRAAEGALSRQPVAPSQGVSDALGAASTPGLDPRFWQFCRARQERFRRSEWPEDPGVAAAQIGRAA